MKKIIRSWFACLPLICFTRLSDAPGDDVVEECGVQTTPLTSALRVSANRSTGCQFLRAPSRLPMGVRTASTITASRMAASYTAAVLLIVAGFPLHDD